MGAWAQGHVDTSVGGRVGAGRGRWGANPEGSRRFYLNSPTSTPMTIFNYISDFKEQNKYLANFFLFFQ